MLEFCSWFSDGCNSSVLLQHVQIFGWIGSRVLELQIKKKKEIFREIYRPIKEFGWCDDYGENARVDLLILT